MRRKRLGVGHNDKASGNGGTACAAAPTRVANLIDVATIAAGNDYSVAILADGSAYAWGLPPPFNDVKLNPVRVFELDGTAKIAAASHVLSLDSADLGRVWGGRSKVGERAPSRSRPGAAHGRHARDRRGANHSLGVTATGEVLAWGLNTYLQLGVARKRASPDWLEVIDPANPLHTRNALPVVEYLNPTIEFGHHSITIDKNEIGNLDRGGIPNWQRTGRAWRAWLTQASTPTTAKPVYRFFSSRWNSHFYTADETGRIK